MLFQESLNFYRTERRHITENKIIYFISLYFRLYEYENLVNKGKRTHEARRGYYRTESLHWELYITLSMEIRKISWAK